MTNQVPRIRSCLALLCTGAVLLVLTGCRLDRGTGSPELPHLFGGKAFCPSRWNVECGACSGFHPTVWQPWTEGPMAARCRDSGVSTSLLQQDLIKKSEFEASGAPHTSPETIPVPEAQKGGATAAPHTIAPPHNEPLPIKGAENLGTQPPAQEKKTTPATREKVPSQEKVPDKPQAPVSSLRMNKPEIASAAILVAKSTVSDSKVMKSSVPETKPEQGDVFPAGFFSHSPVPQTHVADREVPCSDDDCAHFDP
jgi:hypothetical protein